MADRVQWGGGRKKACSDFIHDELLRGNSQRENLQTAWRDWLELYRAPQDKTDVHFPFEGASNLTYPLAAMNVDPIWARYMQNIHASDNLWTLKPLNERWVDIAKPLQDYLTWIDQMILKMWGVNMSVFGEMLKLGTSIYKSHWKFETRNIVGYDAQKQRRRMRQTINQPDISHVSIANFYLPPEAREIDPEKQGGAQWVAERHIIRIPQLAAMAKGQEPFLPNFDPAAVEEVLKWYDPAQTDHDQKISKLEKIDATHALQARESRPISIYEVHIRFDSTGNGVEDDLVIFYHHESMSILRSTYEPFPQRPYTAVRYLRGDGFYGIGVCEQMEMWQDNISDVVNYNIDKVLLSNAPMLRASEGANILPNEGIWPGKVLFGEKDEFEPFWLTSNASLDINALTAFLQEGAKQHGGLTDLQYGTIGSLPSRTPATSVQTLLQEGNTRFDMSMKDVRAALSEVGLRVLQNLQVNATDVINNPQAIAYVELAQRVLGDPEGQLVAQALQIPAEAVELGVGVSLTATSGSSNKELQRQSNLALLQLYGQLGPQFIQLAGIAQQMPGSPMAQTAIELFNGGRELLERVLEQFDVRNPEELVPNVQALLAATQAAQGGNVFSPMAGAQSAGGAPGVPQIGGV